MIRDKIQFCYDTKFLYSEVTTVIETKSHTAEESRRGGGALHVTLKRKKYYSSVTRVKWYKLAP